MCMRIAQTSWIRVRAKIIIRHQTKVPICWMNEILWNNLSNYFDEHVGVSNARFILKIDIFFSRFLLWTLFCEMLVLSLSAARAIRCMLLVGSYVVFFSMKLTAKISVKYSSAYLYMLLVAHVNKMLAHCNIPFHSIAMNEHEQASKVNDISSMS